MKVIVVSDTHGRDSLLEEVIKRETPFDYLIHCGDSEGSADRIRTMTARPVCIVGGNCDFFSRLPEAAEFDLEGVHLIVTHGHRNGVRSGREGLLRLAKNHKAGLICYGHTHVPEAEEEAGVYFLNPGSLTYPRQFDRRPTYGVLTLKGGRVTGEIRCADGE